MQSSSKTKLHNAADLKPRHNPKLVKPGFCLMDLLSPVVYLLTSDFFIVLIKVTSKLMRNTRSVYPIEPLLLLPEKILIIFKLII